jgi:hypothetical protein
MEWGLVATWLVILAIGLVLLLILGGNRPTPGRVGTFFRVLGGLFAITILVGFLVRIIEGKAL